MQHVVSAFGYLALRSYRNRMLWQLRRLANLRYALAMLVGVGYFYFIFFQRGSGGTPPAGTLSTPGVERIVSLAFALLVAKWWLVGAPKGAITFTPAEIHFLFPAPVSRRGLILFHLLRAQIASFFSAMIFIVLLRRDSTGAMVWLRWLSFWLMFSTLHLHQVAASLVRKSATEQGSAGARRNIIPIAVFSIGLAILAWTLYESAGLLRAAWDQGAFLVTFDHVLRQPAAAAVLLPFRVLLGPAFIQDPSDWLRVFAPALALMLAHFPWVLRSDTAFEEGSIEAAAKRASWVSARRDRRLAPVSSAKGIKRTSLPLSPTGHPAVAIAWKNVVAYLRQFRVTTFVIIGVSVMAFYLIMQNDEERGRFVLALIAFMFLVAMIILGPLWTRNDLRLDMPQLTLLRSYPLSGRALVAAEIGGATVVLSGMQYLLLAILLLTIVGTDFGPDPEMRLALTSAAVILLPPLNALALSIHNAAALLFPAWVSLGPDRPGGVAAMGQNLLTIFGTLLVLALLLLAPAAAGGVPAYLWLERAGPWVITAGALPAAIVMVGELMLIAAWLGKVFEGLDPSSATGG